MSLHLVIVEVMHTGRNCKGYKLISQSCDPGISDDGPKNAHDHMCTFKNLIFCIKNVYVYVPVMCTVDMVYSVLQSFISSGFVHTISQMSFLFHYPILVELHVISSRCCGCSCDRMCLLDPAFGS